MVEQPRLFKSGMVVGSNPTRITMQGGIVYILQSQQTQRYYIGSTTNLARRLKDHERGNTKTTRIHKSYPLNKKN